MTATRRWDKSDPSVPLTLKEDLMARRNATILFALIAAALPPALAAQSKGVELGLDGGFSYKVNSPTSLELALPFQRFRVGFTAGRMVSIEPSAVFDYVKDEGFSSDWRFGPELGVLLHFDSQTNRARGYFRPFAGMTFLHSGGESANQFYLGGGVGVKLPLSVSRLAARLEGGLQHGFEGDLPSATSIYALVGLSFFTK
jgi:hypothetical protein